MTGVLLTLAAIALFLRCRGYNNYQADEKHNNSEDVVSSGDGLEDDEWEGTDSLSDQGDSQYSVSQYYSIREHGSWADY